MKRIYLINICAILLLNLGCKKLVEVSVPNDKIITKTVFGKDDIAIASLTGIYARMHEEGAFPYNIALLTGFYGDELKSFSSNQGLVQVYTNNLNPANGTNPNFWQIAYNHIYNANAVYEGCNESTTLSLNIKKQLMAEARFIRAFWHFYLTNLYGDIPIITTTDYTVTSISFSSTQEKVYDQIIDDLQEANASLSDSYLAGNTTSVSSERVRPNKTVAKAFLARVYLYKNDFAKAETMASDVIANSSTYQLENIASVFRKTSKEAIWQIAIPFSPTGSSNTLEATNFILTTKPLSSTVKNAVISEQLMQSFENNDLRKTNWIGKFTDVSGDYYYPNKYKNNGANSSEYTTPFRLSEQYLIRSEARAKLGSNVSGAIDDLNMVRNRAGLITPTSMTQAELLLLIQAERKRELFAEYGHRWFDLKRIGNTDEIMKVVTPLKSGNWASYKQLWPVPLYDIQNNSNLTQNPGYINQ